MLERGKVIELSRNKAKLSFEATDFCKKCKACTLGTTGQMFIEVDNPGNLSIGDEVTIESSSSGSILASFLIFILPVLFLILGYFAGKLMTASENFAIFTSLLFLGISALVLKKIDSVLKKNKAFEIKIVKVHRK